MKYKLLKKTDYNEEKKCGETKYCCMFKKHWWQNWSFISNTKHPFLTSAWLFPKMWFDTELLAREALKLALEKEEAEKGFPFYESKSISEL